MKIDRQIEIVKLIQRVLDNCTETEKLKKDGTITTEFELTNLLLATERTIEDLVNEKLRKVK